jgi:hypothetical protein
MTPAARSTKFLRDHGFSVCRVEQRLPIPGKFVTKDAFGFGDLLAMREWSIPTSSPFVAPVSYDEFYDGVEIVYSAGFSGTPYEGFDRNNLGRGLIVLVQVTSGSNHNARKDKILAEPLAKLWKAAGGEIHLHSWAKRGPRGKKKVWTLRAEQL